MIHTVHATAVLLGIARSVPEPTVVDVSRVAPTAVVIDGVHSPAEWDRAASVSLADSTILRFQHDGRHLFFAIAASRRGFASVCTARGDSVRVLHASAALGSVTYTGRGDTFSSPDTAFTYGMRGTDTTEPARAERRAYLAQHGWVSTTVNMGRSVVHEMQIALDQLDRPPRIALGYFVIGATTSIVAWPGSMSASDGCVAMRLVSGYVPTGLQFTSADWAELRLQR
jgi:hypothetical protein